MLRSKRSEVDIFLAYGTQQKDGIRPTSLNNWFCNWDSSTLTVQLVWNQNLSTVHKKIQSKLNLHISSGYAAKHQQQSVTVFFTGNFNLLLNREKRKKKKSISLVLVNSCNWLHITYEVLNCPPFRLLLLSKNAVCWTYPQESRNFHMASGVFLKL